MKLATSIFPRTVIRVQRTLSSRKLSSEVLGHDYVLFRIYGVQQPMHVIDPRRIVPRNDNKNV